MYFIKLECIILIIFVLRIPVLLRFSCHYRGRRSDQLAFRRLIERLLEMHEIESEQNLEPTRGKGVSSRSFQPIRDRELLVLLYASKERERAFLPPVALVSFIQERIRESRQKIF